MAIVSGVKLTQYLEIHPEIGLRFSLEVFSLPHPMRTIRLAEYWPKRGRGGKPLARGDSDEPTPAERSCADDLGTVSETGIQLRHQRIGRTGHPICTAEGCREAVGHKECATNMSGLLRSCADHLVHCRSSGDREDSILSKILLINNINGYNRRSPREIVEPK